MFTVHIYYNISIKNRENNFSGFLSRLSKSAKNIPGLILISYDDFSVIHDMDLYG